MGGLFLIQKLLKDYCLKIFRPLQISELLVFLKISCLGCCWRGICLFDTGLVVGCQVQSVETTSVSLKIEKSNWVSLTRQAKNRDFWLFFFGKKKKNNVFSRLYWQVACEFCVSWVLPCAMNNAVRGATLAWVSMNRGVSRQPASAQISSKLGSL